MTGTPMMVVCGAQVLWHETELVADGEGLVMSESDDDRRLRCVASVDGLPSNVTAATVTVRCESARFTYNTIQYNTIFV